MSILAPSIGHAAPERALRCMLISLAVAALLAGCSGSQRAAPVDADRAREALKTALDGWKKGDTPAALNQNTPPITAQDMDWLAGAKLLDYAMTGEGKSVEANLYVPVTLSMKMADGKAAKKNVTYVVGTSPYLTVFRALH
jgi:hypothetical protein